MKFLKLLMVAFLFTGLATTTNANTILDVLVDQKLSIENAYRFGKISYFDARDLMLEQARIERAILKADKDGVITEREQKKILKLQRRADHNIWVASSFSSRINRSNSAFYDPFDPWNRFGSGWNQGYYPYGGTGQDCTPTTPGNNNPSPKPLPKKTVRRN